MATRDVVALALIVAGIVSLTVAGLLVAVEVGLAVAGGLLVVFGMMLGRR